MSENIKWIRMGSMTTFPGGCRVLKAIRAENVQITQALIFGEIRS